MTTENQTQWKLVPVEPTREMICAGQDEEFTPDVYRRMLAAAPQPPAQDEPHPVGDTHFEVSPNSVVRAAFAQGYETGRAHGKAEQPPALGGEPEVIYMLRNTALNTPWRDADKAAFDCAAGLVEYERRELVDRAHVARLQAEVERLTSLNAKLEKSNEEYSGAAVDSGMECDRLTARTAELEGLLRVTRQFIKNGIDLGYITMPDPETPDPAHDLLPAIEAALNKTEGQCCTPTAEDRASLAAGDHTPEELWGGPRPTCPKCHKSEGQSTTDTDRLDFMLLKCRKVVVECVPGGSEVYVEEGFMSDKTYPSVSVEGEWKNHSPEAMQARRNAIDLALAEGKDHE